MQHAMRLTALYIASTAPGSSSHNFSGQIEPALRGFREPLVRLRIFRFILTSIIDVRVK